MQCIIKGAFITLTGTIYYIIYRYKKHHAKKHLNNKYKKMIQRLSSLQFNSKSLDNCISQITNPSTGQITNLSTGQITGSSTGPSTGQLIRQITDLSTGQITNPSIGPSTGQITGSSTGQITGPSTGPSTGQITDPSTGPSTDPSIDSTSVSPIILLAEDRCSNIKKPG